MLWLSIVIGAVTGVLSGMGLGGGTLLMLYMTGPGGLAQHAAQGINLLYFIPSALGALWGHIKERRIDWPAVIAAVATGVVISGLTAFLAQRVDAGWLRKIFGAGVIVIGFREVFHTSGGQDTPPKSERRPRRQSYFGFWGRVFHSGVKSRPQ